MKIIVHPYNILSNWKVNGESPAKWLNRLGIRYWWLAVGSWWGFLFLFFFFWQILVKKEANRAFLSYDLILQRYLDRNIMGCSHIIWSTYILTTPGFLWTRYSGSQEIISCEIVSLTHKSFLSVSLGNGRTEWSISLLLLGQFRDKWQRPKLMQRMEIWLIDLRKGAGIFFRFWCKLKDS